MKLVYADDLLYYVDALLDRHHAPAIGGLALHKIVDRMKGIDAVPVVRCNDCKHNLYPGKPNTVCGLNIPIFDGNGYCSEGERKDDE